MGLKDSFLLRDLDRTLAVAGVFFSFGTVPDSKC